MDPFDDDVEEPQFDDRGAEDWEELFSRPERDFDDELQTWFIDEDQDVDLFDQADDDDDDADGPDEAFGSDDHANASGDPSLDQCIRVPISAEMWSEATQWAVEMDQHYGDKNDFGYDDGLRKQRLGVIGAMAYAQAGLGDWRRHRKVVPNEADFGMLDVKSSRFHHHRSLSSLHLIESESSPGIDPPRYPFYVQVFVDDVNRLAYVVGWCTGDELWSHGKTPIPRGGGRLGYQRPVALLRPMLSLLYHWDLLDDGRGAAFRPENLGL